MKVNDGGQISYGEDIPLGMQELMRSKTPQDPKLSPEKEIFNEISTTFSQTLSKLEDCKEQLNYLSCFLKIPEVYGSSLSDDIKSVLNMIDTRKENFDILKNSISDLHIRIHQRASRLIQSDKHKIIGKLLK